MLLCCLRRMFWVIVIHDPFSVLSLREGGCRPKFPGTWPHSIRWSHPVPLAEKHPQSIRFPPPCFTVGMVFLGLYSAFLFLQTRQVELMPNSSDPWPFSSSLISHEARSCDLGAPDRGRLAVTLCFVHFLINAPTVFYFSPSCLLVFL